MQIYRVTLETYDENGDTIAIDIDHFASIKSADAKAEAWQRSICDDESKWIHPFKRVQVEPPSPKFPFGVWMTSDELDTASATYAHDDGLATSEVRIEAIQVEP